jgi:multicomponent Na+:H+ antiporter subunit A
VGSARPRLKGNQLILAVLAAHALGVVAVAALAGRLGRRVYLLAAVPPAAAVVAAAAVAPAVLAGRPVVETYPWAASLGLEVALRLDAFALLMVALVSGIGVLVFVYATAYFAGYARRHATFAATLLGFSGAMLGLVLSDDALLLFAFWELTSATSYLLIGTDDRRPEARGAALHAYLVTAGGGLALLAGLVLLGQQAGTTTISALVADPPSGPLVDAALVLVLLGAFTKSAQVPFISWLPGAMAAPTPVSAYLHSATMVKAGIYLVARLAPAFAATSAVWRPAVLAVGVLTMLVGGFRALRQYDLKRLLAYGTVAQLGFLVVLLGVGTPEATWAGCILLLAHAAFKATLFMGVGIVDHQAHTRDLRRLSGVARRMPWLFAVMVGAGASMAGLPPLLGFLAKEEAFGALGDAGQVAVLAGVVAGSALTTAYTARLLVDGLWRTRAGPDVVDPAGAPTPAAGFVAPAALLTALSLAAGLAPVLVDRLVNAAATALDPAWEGYELALWHGFTTELALSGISLAGGLALWAGSGALRRLPLLPGGGEVFERTVKGLQVGAARLTGVLQNGSLPIYLSVISLAVVTVPGAVLLTRGAAPPLPRVAANPVQAVVALVVVVAAVLAAAAGRRFAAVLSLGAVGYGVAVLFVLQGAPDLALTQFLFETLALVVFVLVLRNLPDRFAVRALRSGQALRAVVAVVVGTVVAGFALVATAARTAPPAGREYLARALPEAEGRNVVNTILVDFRGLDTLGEITVLVVAALGVTSLVAVSRRAAGRAAAEDRRELEEAET